MENQPTIGIFVPAGDPQAENLAQLAEQCFGKVVQISGVKKWPYNGDADDAMVSIFDFARHKGFEIVVFRTDLDCDNPDALLKGMAQVPRDTFVAIIVKGDGSHNERLARQLDTMSPVGSQIAIYTIDDLSGPDCNHVELIGWRDAHKLAAPSAPNGGNPIRTVRNSTELLD